MSDNINNGNNGNFGSPGVGGGNNQMQPDPRYANQQYSNIYPTLSTNNLNNNNQSQSQNGMMNNPQQNANQGHQYQQQQYNQQGFGAVPPQQQPQYSGYQQFPQQGFGQPQSSQQGFSPAQPPPPPQFYNQPNPSNQVPQQQNQQPNQFSPQQPPQQQEQPYYPPSSQYGQPQPQPPPQNFEQTQNCGPPSTFQQSQFSQPPPPPQQVFSSAPPPPPQNQHQPPTYLEYQQHSQNYHQPPNQYGQQQNQQPNQFPPQHQPSTNYTQPQQQFSSQPSQPDYSSQSQYGQSPQQQGRFALPAAPATISQTREIPQPPQQQQQQFYNQPNQFNQQPQNYGQPQPQPSQQNEPFQTTMGSQSQTVQCKQGSQQQDQQTQDIQGWVDWKQQCTQQMYQGAQEFQNKSQQQQQSPPPQQPPQQNAWETQQQQQQQQQNDWQQSSFPQFPAQQTTWHQEPPPQQQQSSSNYQSPPPAQQSRTTPPTDNGFSHFPQDNFPTTHGNSSSAPFNSFSNNTNNNNGSWGNSSNYQQPPQQQDHFSSQNSNGHHNNNNGFGFSAPNGPTQRNPNSNMYGNQGGFPYNNFNNFNNFNPRDKGREIGNKFNEKLFNNKHPSPNSLFETTFVFGEAVFAVLKEWKQKELSVLDQRMKGEAERGFIDCCLSEDKINEMIFKKDSMSLLLNICKKGKYDNTYKIDGKHAFSEVRVKGEPKALVMCFEESTLKRIWDGIVGFFKQSIKISPSSIMYLKISKYEHIIERYINKKIMPLWIKQIPDQNYFIIAINKNGVKLHKGVKPMDEEEVLKALTGVGDISQTAMTILSKVDYVDYGQDNDTSSSGSSLHRCENFLDCENHDKKHRENYMHVCKYGDRCTDKDPKHRKICYHIPLKCRFGNGCTDTDPEHRMVYHGEVKKWCTQNPCREYGKPEHMRDFMHGPRPAKFISFDGFTTEVGSVPDFDGNMEYWMKKTGKYLKCSDIRSANRDFQRISDWMRSLQSVHQCSGKALGSIAKIGVIASLNKLRSMWLNPEDIAHIVWIQKEGEELLKRLNSDEDTEKYDAAKKYVKMYCRILQAERSPKIVEELQQKVIMGIPIDSLKFAFDVFRNVPPLRPDEKGKWDKMNKKVSSVLKKDIGYLRKLVEDVIKIVQETLENVSAISFDVDRKIGTDRAVFAIHGPNMGKYGDAEVAIVFKPEISRHPDFFMTPIAAMGYYQGWYINNSRVGTDRPWMGEAKAWENPKEGRTGDSAKQDYERSKFHGTTKGWTDACAMEWISRIVQNGRTNGNPKRPEDVTLRDIQELWHNSDPHTAIEAHLPGLISLDLIERVYIANSARSSIGDAESVLRKFGVDRIEFVDDTRDAVERFMNDPQRLQSRQSDKNGYEFYVEEGGREHVVPIDVEKLRDKVIRFTVVNSGSETMDLMISFSDKIPGTDKHRKSGTIALLPFSSDGFHFGESPKRIIEGKPPLTEPVKGFSSFVLNEVVYFTLIFTNDSIVLRKSGVSSVFNSSTVKINRGPARFISFSSKSFPCYISNVIVSDMSGGDSNALSHAQTMQMSPKGTRKSSKKTPSSSPLSSSGSSSSSFLSGFSSSSSSSSHSSNSSHNQQQSKPSSSQSTIEKKSGGNDNFSKPGHSNSFNVPSRPFMDNFTKPNGQPPPKPPKPQQQHQHKNSYCNDKFSCPIANNPKDPGYQQHVSQMIHVCKYGQSCNKKGDPFHKTRFYHYKKEPCRYGEKCTKLTDPKHRAEFYHPGLWDWMEVCPSGQRCPHINDKKHCLKYSHTGWTTYPDEVTKK